MEIAEIGKEKIKDFTLPKPINLESTFHFEELFFSITDVKSNILYGNDTFVRISKYKDEEIIGRLHKLIRHPDMPRAVFHIFWDFLNAQKPIAAYVKNLAKDGSYYWVMATAFPCKGGYISVRMKPGSPLFTKIKKFYAETLDYEKQMEKQTDKKKAMLAAEEYLINLIRKEGFSGYEEFMWKALQSEMAHRDSIISKKTVTRRTAANQQTSSFRVPSSLQSLEQILGELVLSLDHLKGIHEVLNGHSGYILKLARSILLLSLNAQVGSSRLDQTDLSLSVVAEKMGEQSVSGEEQLINMQKNIKDLNELIGILNFDIISAKIQVEMAIAFLKEVERRKENPVKGLIDADEALHILKETFMPRVRSITLNIQNVPVHLKNLLNGVKKIKRFLMVLRFIHISGKVEVARMNDDAQSFNTTFQDLIKEIETAESHLKGLSEVVEDNRKTADLYSRFKDELQFLGKEINI